MADISEKLSELLSSPDGMEKLQGAAAELKSILGDNPDATSLLSGLFDKPKPPTPTAAAPDLSLLSKAAPFLAAMQQEDDSAKLLKALRPYMHGERLAKLDEAIEMLKWLRLAMMLKEKGVL